MIWLHEYKQYKQMAEQYIKDGMSLNIGVQIQILKYELKQTTYEEAIENIIYVLSDGQHQKLTPA